MISRTPIKHSTTDKGIDRLKGTSLPFRFGTAGGVVMEKGLSKIKQNIRAILMTTVGERTHRPSFGSQISLTTMFRNLNEGTKASMQEILAASLRRYEPRVTLISVVLSQDNSSVPGEVLVEITYKVSSTGSYEQMTVAFEGR
jgi:phage baseplate assembly protein W